MRRSVIALATEAKFGRKDVGARQIIAVFETIAPDRERHVPSPIVTFAQSRTWPAGDDAGNADLLSRVNPPSRRRILPPWPISRSLRGGVFRIQRASSASPRRRVPRAAPCASD